MSWLAHIVRHALVHWGYLALFAGLLGENAGLPLPGETILMFAAFLSHKSNGLQLPWLILVGIAAAVAGDNLGFFIGRRLGPHLLGWMCSKFHMEDDIAAATDQIQRHGPATVFWARYIVGLRTIAGPVAGAMGMDWKTFLLYNGLGAASWVTATALVGYAFGNEFESLLSYFEKASWAITAGIFGIGYFLWRRKKKQVSEKIHGREQPAVAD
jgi:membrane-associated protein